MAELDTEHVRMLDAGRQRVAYSSPLTASCFASVASKKTQLLQHGNTFGLSFVASEKGFVMTKNDELEASCTDYTKRRQEAIDHGQKLTLEEIHELPVTKEIQLPSIAYWIELSPDELMLAAAYGDSVALFEVAHIVEAAAPVPFHTFSKLQAQEIAWCTDSTSERLAVLILEKQVVVCTLEGERNAIDTQTPASSISWSPSGEQIAVGLVDGSIAIYARDSLQFVRSIAQPECCAEQGLEAHHVNWAEEELILAGYQKYDEENEETSALACIFDKGECVELDEVAGFFDVEGRRHQYFSVFLPDWRMFFIGCSLSADIELLVSDPEGGEWALWKPLEKYQARLPMNAEDEDSFPMGFALNLNSTTPVPVDEDAFPPVPIISCSNTEGLLVNFAFVDTTVNEVEFVKSPSPFENQATRVIEVTSNAASEIKVEVPESPKKTTSHEYGQNDENEFAESDGESSDEEEERKEEEDTARATFRTIASDGADYIASDLFPKLFKAMGSTYDEEEHASTVASLEKDGNIYEADFVSWYVSWIFGDEDSDSDEDAPASSEAKPAEMKSKEEIAAAFSRFTAKEGSWKCEACMVGNGPEAMKCSACETANPAAPKMVAPVTAASATTAGSIGSGGFSFPVSTGDASKPSSFSFGVTPAAGSDAADATKPGGFSFGGAAATTGFSFPSSTTSSGTGFTFPTSSTPATGFGFEVGATSTAPATTSGGFSFGDGEGESTDGAVASNTVSSVKETQASSPKKTVLHEYGQNVDNEFAESDGEESDEEEERKEEEDKAKTTFRTIASDDADFILSEQFPKLFKAMGSAYDEAEHASTVASLEKDGKIYEADFVSWYVNWIFGDSDSDSEEETFKKTILHEYGQNDENEFAESDGESSDEEEERKEEEDTARATFRTIASDGADYIASDLFPKLFKAMGSTYDEEEHASTVASLEKDGNIYEADFVSWYVSWIFGDEDSDSDEDAPASSEAKPAEMKSKEEIAAAFSRFTAKEGSWKCEACMVGNGPEAMKCSACETANPAAPKMVAPVTAASATTAGSIGSGGFSFPVSTGDASKPSSFSFGVTPAAGSDAADATKPGGFSFGGAAATTGFSFPSSTTSSGTGFTFPTSSTPATGFGFEVGATSTAPATTSGGFSFGDGEGESTDGAVASNTVSSVKETQASSPKKTVLHEYGQNVDNEFAESDGEESDEEEERKEEEDKAKTTFRTIASDDADFILSEQFPKLFKAMGSAYDEAEHASTVASLEKDGKIYEADFVSWYVNWIFGDSDSDSEEETFKKTILHEYGQNDENEFAESDGESSDEEEERKEEEDTARATFRTIASDGADYIASDLFPKLFKAMGSTYDEEEHASTVASLEKDGNIYEADFVSWYVSWIFGDEDSDSDEDAPASSEAKPAEMKSKEEIAAAFSRFTAKEGSWKCEACMVGNGPEAMKCSACETANPAAPKMVAPVTAASATTAGSIGSGGFSFPVSTGDASKPSSFSFGVTPAAGSDAADATKPGGFSFGGAAATTGFSFPSSTTSSGTGFTFPTSSTPATSAAPAASNSSSVYPPGTTSKPKPPAFGAASSGGYPPDTTSKPKPPAFGAASSSGYPPDTTSKPKPPAFGAASSGGYPPDTTSKPKPPAFGAASSSGYPPDTTSKPKPPAFGAASSSGYPPDTTSKPKPPAFGAGSSGYTSDTTSKPKPPMFGQSTTSDKTTLSSSFGFGTFGKRLFGSKPEASASTDSSAQANSSVSTVTPTKPKSLFGSGFGSSGDAEKAPDTSSSPFGVVPKANSKSAFSFGSTSASDSKEVAAKTSSARPSFSFDGPSLMLDTTEKRDSSEDQPPTKRTLNFGDAKMNSAPSTKAKAKPVAVKASKATPSSRMEGQLWKLIVDFDKSLQRVNESSKNISSKDVEYSKTLLAQMDKLRSHISSLCDEINNLDESRDHIEKDVLFVIGSDGDVHEQLEYGREILNSFNDESLKRTLEEQPLDQRSKETWESLKDKLSEVEKCCVELDIHLSSSKIGADGTAAVSSAHLFRVLKQTYDNSKMQYNKACKLAEHLEKLSLHGDHMRQTNGVSGISGGDADAHHIQTKTEMVQMIVETEQRSQDVRRNFLSLCNNVVTPRDVFSTPRRKLAPPTPSNSSNSPLRVKACSKLMPKTQLSVASPMSSAKQSSRSVSFKDTPVKSGSKLFSLAEAMAPKEDPAKLVQTPQPAKPSVGVGKAPQRPSLGGPSTEAKPTSTTSTTASKSNVFSFPKPAKETTSSFGVPAAKEEEKMTTSTASSFGGFGVNSPAVKSKPKADAESAPAFSLGGKAPASTSTFSFGSEDSKSATQPLSTASATTDYKALLEKFYMVHNPSKAGSVIEKALTTYKGREEDLFTRLFTMYVPDSTPEDVKKYLNGGSVPPKSGSATAASKSPAPAATAAKSPFGGFGASTTTPKDSAAKPSPFGASPSAFSLGPAANKSSGFGGFGSTAAISSTTPSTTTAPSPFGKPAVDYRQKLVEFYQKYNPDKLSSVDATLQKYKGNEEKLFHNLAVKYKVNDASGGVPASPAVQPAKPNAAASPFGKPGAFSAPNTSTGTTFGSSSLVGFGATPSASPFGAANASPFGATSQTTSGFGSTSGAGFGGFQSTTATTPAFGSPSPFGATAGGFGAAAGGVDYREKLTVFYQQHNPTKLNSVDATLEKYKGREDHLFAMLEQKYVKKTPTAPAAGGFGIPSTSSFGGGGGFGAPSALGPASAAPAFGSASSLGGAAQPAFGGAAGSGFGMASRMGGGFGSAAPTAPSGGATGSGFSSFGSQTPSFGGAAQQSGGFGATASSGGFGSGFGGGAAAGGFGQAASFSNPSFTQMRLGQGH